MIFEGGGGGVGSSVVRQCAVSTVALSSRSLVCS